MYIYAYQSLSSMLSFRPCGFREEFFSSYFSNCRPVLDNDAPGRGQFGPQGHGWHDL